MVELMRKTRVASIEIRTYYLFRMGVIAWKI